MRDRSWGPLGGLLGLLGPLGPSWNLLGPAWGPLGGAATGRKGGHHPITPNFKGRPNDGPRSQDRPKTPPSGPLPAMLPCSSPLPRSGAHAGRGGNQRWRRDATQNPTRRSRASILEPAQSHNCPWAILESSRGLKPQEPIGSEKAREQNTLSFYKVLKDFGFSGASSGGSLTT